MTTTLDRRLHAYRPDLADIALEGQVEARRFTAGTPARVVRGATDLRATPDRTTGIDTQLLYGEAVTCFDIREGFGWIRNARDGYVGYVDADALGDPAPPPTHAVTALRTFVYPEPDMKTAVQDALSFTSGAHVVDQEGAYARLDTGGWVFRDHLGPVDEVTPDVVATARRFLGLPYRWGGKTSVGLDCSALVQFAFHAAGQACPRDSDHQGAAVGSALEPGETIRYGDVLFFPGHVALALDAEHVVHATAHTMLVCEEPLEAIVARSLEESGRGLTGHRRLPDQGL